MFEFDFTAILGFAAAILSTFAGVPQMVKAWRTRSTGDLSHMILLHPSGGMSRPSGRLGAGSSQAIA